jgi:hypothetical protein
VSHPQLADIDGIAFGADGNLYANTYEGVLSPVIREAPDPAKTSIPGRTRSGAVGRQALRPCHGHRPPPPRSGLNIALSGGSILRCL